MKRIILQFLLVAGLCLPASAQNEERSMVLAISPIAAIGGGVDVLYQAKMTDFLAITVPVSFYYRWGYSKRFNGFPIEPKIFPKPKLLLAIQRA